MTIYAEVEALVRQGLWPAEIRDKLEKVTTEVTVRQYCYQIMAKLPEIERKKIEQLRALRTKPKVGPKGFFQQKPLGQIHLYVGARLYSFRKDNKLSHQDFCTQFDFSNRTQLSKMEQGYHDFTICEVLRLSQILSTDFFSLLTPESFNGLSFE